MAGVVRSNGEHRIAIMGGRTILLMVGAVGIAALITTGIELMWGGIQTARPAEYIGVPVVSGLSAAITLGIALKLESLKERIRWMAVAASSAVVSAGGLVWLSLNPQQTALGFYDATPPGLYVLQYALILAVTVSVLRDARLHGHTMKYMIWGLGVTVGVSLAVWLVVLEPALKGPGLVMPLYTAVGLITIETLVIGLPAVTLQGALSQAAPTFAASWRMYCTAVLVLVVADVGWVSLQATNGWHPGSLVGFGWMVAYGLMAAAASLALDGDRAAAAHCAPVDCVAQSEVPTDPITLSGA